MRTCSKCNQEKDDGDYYVNKARSQVYAHCKDCHYALGVAWRAANETRAREIAKEQKRRQYADTAGRVAILATNARWAARNPDIKRKHALAAGRKWSSKNKDLINAKTIRRVASKLQATPPWSEVEKIRVVYAKALMFSAQVDHIVPLRSPLVCGLHVWSNLQLLPKGVNQRKSNQHWPDMPGTL